VSKIRFKASHVLEIGTTPEKSTPLLQFYERELAHNTVGCIHFDHIAILEPLGCKFGPNDARYIQFAGHDGRMAGHPALFGDNGSGREWLALSFNPYL
jgi:hypothetical protein